MSFAGKRALVVGGAKGIGLATARRLCSAGGEVIVWDNDAAALEGLDFLEAGARALVELTDRAAVAERIAGLRQAGTRLDAVIVAAGVHATCPVEFMSDALLDRTLEVNFTAHAKLVRDLIPLMAPDGRIVGVSSIAAAVGIPMSSAYAASKAALELFYETLATELLPRRLWAVIVQPGNVNTGFNETGNDFRGAAGDPLAEGYRKVVDSIHSRHGMPPEAVAEAICAALAARRPRLHYVVGKNAAKANLAKRLLGRQGAAVMLRRHFGLGG
ncbi:NAD(P)-dependent dehydrogenase, short-chain alcohol dehydrogenase family [Tistlia consotensis]|uniref:NAD(P)-dependent dehydrogenase, short-chain alcohol dehydrogenase family n=1 Tax=Tistlia consotensis USBA 355 TaxID=560819 RepID=A0A1Y6BDW2_9PROT|nr:SDR family NAD(P)-dependent oxidoreductase [Tistlia consotensis]SME98860.1 NAD(P)-dependent dehydrogenase, short-chain alcohol dehydrogenase family [Tistlia consotensis USBA 355]SNR58293.1 NAD(P)-dependent dehydrogenase, short-chain alcohol dehydrogenase family [Tistlia consotensis]